MAAKAALRSSLVGWSMPANIAALGSKQLPVVLRQKDEHRKSKDGEGAEDRFSVAGHVAR